MNRNLLNLALLKFLFLERINLVQFGIHFMKGIEGENGKLNAFGYEKNIFFY